MLSTIDGPEGIKIEKLKVANQVEILYLSGVFRYRIVKSANR